MRRNRFSVGRRHGARFGLEGTGGLRRGGMKDSGHEQTESEEKD